MINIHKRNLKINRLLRDKNLCTKIYLYMSTKSVGEDFDSEENNYTYSNLNPITVKGYVTDIKPESLVYRQVGLAETGAVEVLCENRFAEYFRLANKIIIDDDQFQVYKDNVGNRLQITKIPFELCKIMLVKVR
jgi:hypothetical protein